MNPSETTPTSSQQLPPTVEDRKGQLVQIIVTMTGLCLVLLIEWIRDPSAFF